MNVSIKGFGSKDSEVKRLKEYKVVVKPYAKDSSISINVLAVPTICAVISQQLINEAIKRHHFLRQLKLANDGTHPQLPVGVLLGSDY